MPGTKKVSGSSGTRSAPNVRSTATSSARSKKAVPVKKAAPAKSMPVSKKGKSIPATKAKVAGTKAGKKSPAKKVPTWKLKRYRCRLCGYVYSPLRGEPHNGIPAGTPFEDLPEDYVCPVCGYQGRGKIGKWGFDEWAPTRYICSICGYVYDEKRGEPHRGIKPGTKFDDLPDDYKCPVCAQDPKISVQFGKVFKQGFEPLNMD
ncbi:MAG: rubredoxin [Methanoregula sp.]